MFVCLSIYGFTVLLVGLGQLFQLLDLLHSRLESVDGGSARRKAHTRLHKQNKRTQTHMPQVGLEPRIPVFERAKTVDASDRVAAVVGMWALYIINMN
jgi:hypothetical protein